MDKVVRHPKEGQDNPKDQMKCTIGSIRGWISNLRSGVSSPERVAQFVNSDLDRVMDLLERYPDLEWDSDLKQVNDVLSEVEKRLKKNSEDERIWQEEKEWLAEGFDLDSE